MITGKEDLLQSLIEVFIMEKGTKIFYSEAADRAVHQDTKKTFRELALWEEKHMDFIQYLYQSINGDGEVRSFEDFRNKVEAPVTEAGIPVKDLEEKMEKYIYKDEMGALALAMEIEGKAYNLYQRLSEDAADANARVVFREMMGQEARHIDYLKTLKARLADVYK
jgi:rubrerythrin